MTYYLIHSKPRQELRAQEHLENQGFECFLPLHLCEKIKGGKRTPVLEPLFPRYLFIRLNDSTDDWGAIRSTKGVSQMVRFGLSYASVEDSFVEALRDRLGQAETNVEPIYRPGQQVKIVNGPFAGLDAIFKENDGEARVVVLLNFLQQQKPVSLPHRAVQFSA